jgi:hypothetical protein
MYTIFPPHSPFYTFSLYLSLFNWIGMKWNYYSHIQSKWIDCWNPKISWTYFTYGIHPMWVCTTSQHSIMWFHFSSPCNIPHSPIKQGQRLSRQLWDSIFFNMHNLLEQEAKWKSDFFSQCWFFLTQSFVLLRHVV